MNKTWYWAAPLSLGIAVGAGIWLLKPGTVPNDAHAGSALDKPTSKTLASAVAQADSYLQDSEADANPDWLQHPKVRSYLQRESQKDAMRAYFNSDENDPDTAQAMWEYIASLEASGAVMGFEALHLKMAWLEKNSATRDEFKQRANSMLESYRQQAKANTARFNPENTPQFKSYKQQEKAIVAEVSQMSDFPNGMTQQQYLRQRLLEARIAAYESGTNSANEATEDDETELTNPI